MLIYIREYPQIRALITPNILIEQATSLILDLQVLHKLAENSIDVPQIEILQDVAAHPDSTAYGISRKKVLRKDRNGNHRDERWIRRQLSDLEEKGLIKRTQKSPSQHGAKPCKLTISGLIYLIMRREITYYEVIKGILKYYSNNVFFQLFVYPYIEQDTLQALTSFNSLSPLSLFLYECGRELRDAVRTINLTKNKYLTEGPPLVWQSVPDDKHSTGRLLNFLRQELNLKWTDYARIEKVRNGNTLRVSHNTNSILIELNQTRTKVIITKKGKMIFELNVMEHVKETENSKGCFVLELPSKITTIEWAAKFLIEYTQSRVPFFVYNLVHSINPESDDFQILSQDKTFLNILDKTKIKFDNQYEMLAKLKDASPPLYHERF